MIEVQDGETVVRGAKHDFLAIEGSKMDGQDELLKDVIQAVAVLKPEAQVYFKDHQPSKSSVALSQTALPINGSSDQSSASSGDDNAADKNGADPNVRAGTEATARIMLREVRSTLNDFRDKRWEALVRQRSRLLIAIAVTGIVTSALLSITILTSAP